MPPSWSQSTWRLPGPLTGVFFKTMFGIMALSLLDPLSILMGVGSGGWAYVYILNAAWILCIFLLLVSIASRRLADHHYDNSVVFVSTLLCFSWTCMLMCDIFFVGVTFLKCNYKPLRHGDLSSCYLYGNPDRHGNGADVSAAHIAWVWMAMVAYFLMIGWQAGTWFSWNQWLRRQVVSRDTSSVNLG